MIYQSILVFFIVNQIVVRCANDHHYQSTKSTKKSGQIVDIEVFGESNCIHTTLFLQNQLLPAYKTFGSRLQIQYHPFGVPRYTSCAWNGTQIECTCQHGPLECEKNSLQSCVISYFPETDTHLEIVNCIQGASEFDESVQKCLVEHKPPLRVPSDRLVRCALSDGGRSLMGYHGVVQHYRASRLQWVPWIVINGVRDNEAERDLKRVLCTRYLKPRPSICEAYPIDPTEPI